MSFFSALFSLKTRPITAYTDPTDPSSFLAITLEPLPAPSSSVRAAESSPSYAVTWPSAPNRIYTLYAADSLMNDATVTPLATLSGTGDTLSVPVPHSSSTPILFFYLAVDLPPVD